MIARLCDYTIGNIALLGFTQRQATRVYDVPLWNVKQSRARAQVRLRRKLVALKSCNVEWRFYYNSRERENRRWMYIVYARREIISSQKRLKCTPSKRKKSSFDAARHTAERNSINATYCYYKCWLIVIERACTTRELKSLWSIGMRATTAGFNVDMRDAMFVLQ